jgi:pyrimidine deaminase RibD-like protein/predicted nucleotidyltransferase
MRSKDFVTGNVAYNETLCPAAWDGETMRPEVREKLLQIAEVFVGYLDIPDFEVLDIVLTGSLANYNWTRHSDFDIHVITRYADLQCDDIAEAFYRAKKQIWNDAHDITVYGHEVELYVEDVNEPPVSAGVFSLKDNRWLSLPEYKQPKISTGAVNHKVQDLIVQIKNAIKTANDPEDINRIRTKLRYMRRAGLDSGGEFSVENLAFKVLRNLGYIDKLGRAYHSQQDRELSLESHDHHHEIVNTEKLDQVLVKLCKMVLSRQKENSEYYGMVGAAVVDPDNNIVASTSTREEGKVIHAERNAIDKYRAQYNEIPEGCVIVTTLSPCNEPMHDRAGSSCTDLINTTNIKKVYAGYTDPTQHDHDENFTIGITNNKEIESMCKRLADTFL